MATPSGKSFEGHVAVRWKDCIVVLCWPPRGCHEVWTFNLWTEEWKKRRNYTPTSSQQHRNTKFPRRGHSSVAIEADIYMFGSDYSYKHYTAAPLWKLPSNGSFEWDTTDTNNDKAVPSPRSDHCAWEYAEKLWIFGGYGVSPARGFLNDHGDFKRHFTNFYHSLGWNNQVLCYNPSIQTWTNVQCSGGFPSPRAHSSAAIINDRAWLYGGSSYPGYNLWHELFELSMKSFVWTQVEMNMVGHVPLKGVSLTKMTDGHLVLHCLPDTFPQYKSTHIFDVRSYAGREHSVSVPDKWDFNFHTATTGLNSSVIVLGGRDKDTKITTGNYYEVFDLDHSQEPTYNPVCFVMIEPKSLQHLAMAEISKHRRELPWKSLPQKLICQIKGP